MVKILERESALVGNSPDRASKPRMTPLRLALLICLAVTACVQSGQARPANTNASAPQAPTPSSPGTPAPPREGDPVIAAAGDIACDTNVPSEGSCHQQATSDLVLTRGYSQVLTLGDNQYEDGTLNEFRTYFHPTWGQVKRQINPSVGNHEYQTPGALGYFRYFRGRAGDRNRGYYSFDISAWHLVALNSNCGEVSCAGGSAQVRWLRADLATNDARCTLAFWHHPRWSSGVTHGDDEDVAPFVRALYDDGAELVLVGHEHNYERFAPQDPHGQRDDARGVRQIVVGTGGSDHHGFGPADPNSERRNSDTFGILELTLHPTSYQWRFVPEAGQAFTDSGRTNCH